MRKIIRTQDKEIRKREREREFSIYCMEMYWYYIHLVLYMRIQSSFYASVIRIFFNLACSYKYWVYYFFYINRQVTGIVTLGLSLNLGLPGTENETSDTSQQV